MALYLFHKTNKLNHYMKHSIILILFFSLSISLIAQTSIKITNKEHAEYKRIPGTQLKIVPPENYISSDRFNGYENKLAGSSIMVFKAPGSVRENFLAFKQNKDITKGMVVSKEELYKINGFDAMLQYGAQFSYGKAYFRYVFVIGDYKNTYVLNASWLKDKDSKKEGERIKNSLLSIIYFPKDSTLISDAFDYTVDNSICDLKPGNFLMNSLVFTDDGQIPSKTEAKSAFMVNKSTIPVGQDHEKYILNILKSYPIEYSDKQDIEPLKVKINGLDGFEIFAIGNNNKLKKSELLYIVVLFDGTTVYQMTGTTLKYYEERLECFKKMSRSFKKR